MTSLIERIEQLESKSKEEDVAYGKKVTLELTLNELKHTKILLETAKAWVKAHARGTERYGLTASSGAKRLRGFGIWVKSKIEAQNWFLNNKNDVRSSYFLEDTATEFDIQGLELDWTIIGWDANLRFENGDFAYYNFKGAKWQRINNLTDRRYLKNAYRVLLTRARQGFVIFIPPGDPDDYSRPLIYYDGIFNYLKSLGIKEVF